MKHIMYQKEQCSKLQIIHCHTVFRIFLQKRDKKITVTIQYQYIKPGARTATTYLTFCQTLLVYLCQQLVVVAALGP